jgi:hypothetical protein
MNGDEKKAGFEGWAVVELFGHKRMAGYVSSQEIAGSSLVRIDVPVTMPTDPRDSRPVTAAYTKLVGVAAIYGITPCTEVVARLAAREIERWNDPIPVQLPALPAASSPTPDADIDDDPDLEWDDEDMEPGERVGRSQ